MEPFTPVKPKVTIGPPEGGFFRETWARLRRLVLAPFWAVRRSWLLHRGVVRARRWHNSLWAWLLFVVVLLVIVAFVAWGFWGLWFRTFDPSLTRRPFYVPCDDLGTSCDTGTMLVTPFFIAAVGTVIFLAGRQWMVRRHYTRRMKADAKRYVQTAGQLLDEVVGRDQLCHAIMNNLRDRKARRPHVIVGSVGAGKTALMVRLAQLLAARGAIPVPIQLRDADTTLDFCELAQKRFETIVQDKALTEGELDRCWRWLRHRSDKIVVLADGLEEALNDPKVVGQRDTMIREAIRRAGEEGLPLVIASRPHDPLRGMQAAITDLEPLSAEAALRYIGAVGVWRSDPVLLDRIVEVSNVAESPLYLQISRELHQKNRLEQLWRPGIGADPMSQDKWALRVDLLQRWLDALVDGEIRPELPIDHDTRQAVIEYLSALACMGLAVDNAKVPLRALDPAIGGESDNDGSGPVGQNGADGQGKTWYAPSQEWTRRVVHGLDDAIGALQPDIDALRREQEAAAGGSARPRPRSLPSDGERSALDPQGPRMDVRLAATWGVRMGLVREEGDAVRFQHSIMQAFLGSRFLRWMLGPDDKEPVLEVEWGVWVRAAMLVGGGPAAPVRGAAPRSSAPASSGQRLPVVWQDTGHLTEALRSGGRELLIALTLYSRSVQGHCLCRGEEWPRPCPVTTVRRLLEEEAAALLEEADEDQELQKKAERARRNESAGKSGQRAQRSVDDRGSLRMRALEAYGAAVEIDSVDAVPSHGRLVKQMCDNWWRLGRGEDRARLRDTKLAVVRQCGAATRRLAEQGHNPAYTEMFAIGAQEPDDRVRSVVAQEIGAGHQEAYEAVYSELEHLWGDLPDSRPLRPLPTEPPVAADGSERDCRAWHRLREQDIGRRERWWSSLETSEERAHWNGKKLRGWVLPMLVVSTPLTRRSGTPSADLERSVSEVTRKEHENGIHRMREASTRADGGETPLPGRGEQWAIGLALAKGMKYAANKRPGTEVDNAEARKFLVKQARILLRESDFWYTRLTLLQALTLWALPDDVSAPQPIRGHGADPRALIREWLAPDRDHLEHPLVDAAGRLAVRALETRRPERFLWIDEMSTASEVGTEVSSPSQQRAHNLWIPPSTGWSSLDPTAQQLLADVLLLVELSERDYRPSDLLALYESGKHQWSRLPSCLSRDRSRLRPVQAVEHDTQPGDNCTDDCRLRMCPYPAKSPPLNFEFSEVFCLRQRELLRRWQPRAWLFARFRREAPWQRKVPVSGMRQFWEQMGRRACDAEPDPAPLRGDGATH
ncbi:NACHT domain-containing protein [Streptomyces sp. NPDC058442]|uniref:NACHT domain-containing protein n=1 Tax=Streptomyces sp. NPDC058442 TaxID=3346503 RepID=UPI0036466465